MNRFRLISALTQSARVVFVAAILLLLVAAHAWAAGLELPPVIGDRMVL